MKRCSRCREDKSTSEFHRNRNAKDGLQARCKPCHVASVTESIRRNPKRHLAQTNKWRRTHPEAAARIAERSKAWQRARARDARLTSDEKAALAPLKLEQQRKRERQWQIDNPERVAELNRRGAMRRYARKKGAAGNATVDQIAERWEMWGGMCWMCGLPAEHTDHVIPLNDGGSDWPSNQRPACAPCNREKAALHLDLSEIMLLTKPRRRVLTESATA